jgi:hypothetical protein
MDGGIVSRITNADTLPAPRSKRRVPRKLHAFFVGFTIIFTVLVLAGFGRSFFIAVATATFSRPPIVHIHAALFFGWTALLLLQPVLAATRRLRMHRKIGSLSAWLILPMLITGSVVAARDTINDFNAGEGDERLAFFYGELADLAMFGLLTGAAMLLRNKPETHKRWVILGSLGLLGAAVGRLPEISSFGFYIFSGLIASVAVYDVASRRSVHWATIVGAAVLLVLNLTQTAIGNSSAWLHAAHYLLQV